MNIIFNTQDCIMALFGGSLIGISATLMMLFNGRVTGISGILHKAVTVTSMQSAWRIVFLIGLIVGGFVANKFIANPFQSTLELPTLRFIVAGLIVGIGTQLSNGCTSGHGVCGMSRLSLRSLTATLAFISTGVITTYLLGVF